MINPALTRTTVMPYIGGSIGTCIDLLPREPSLRRLRAVRAELEAVVSVDDARAVVDGLPRSLRGSSSRLTDLLHLQTDVTDLGWFNSGEPA
jgi:hypothetical protein